MTATQPPLRRRLGPEERRDGILAAARSAFATASYAEVSVPAIARQAGGSPAIVFHYFGSKEGLYAAVVEADLAHLADRQRAADQALPAGTTARDRVRTWVLARLDHVAAHARGSLAREEPTAAAGVRDRARTDDLALLTDLLQANDSARDRFALLGFLGFLDAAGAAWASAGCPEDERHPMVEASLGALEGALGDWRR
ncbi:MAG: TetR/AcrR family transcriptional regulator [Propionibacteriaceae bacterium]|nr:TetR/AcrR family transcriptional regulator [Propionibacteriaceae bacterium]